MLDADSLRYILIGVISGSVGECGLKMKPGMFALFTVRLLLPG